MTFKIYVDKPIDYFPRTASTPRFAEEWSEFFDTCKSGEWYSDNNPNASPLNVRDCVLRWYNDTTRQEIGPRMPDLPRIIPARQP